MDAKTTLTERLQVPPKLCCLSPGVYLHERGGGRRGRKGGIGRGGGREREGQELLLLISGVMQRRGHHHLPSYHADNYTLAP